MAYNVPSINGEMHLEAHDITEISDRISKNAALLKDFLNARGLPQPSFDADAPSRFPNPKNEVFVQFARESILEDTKLFRFDSRASRVLEMDDLAGN